MPPVGGAIIHATLGNDGIHSAVPGAYRHTFNNLEAESGSNRNGIAPMKEPVIKSSTESQPGSFGTESGPRDDHKTIASNPYGFIPGWLGNPISTGNKSGYRFSLIERDSVTGHAGKCHPLPGPDCGLEEAEHINFASDRKIKKDNFGTPECRKAGNACAYQAASDGINKAGVRRPAGKHLPPYHGFFLRYDSLSHRVSNFITVLALLVLAVFSSGCLPILLAGPNTLKPGDMTISLAGMGRADHMPDQIKRAGSASGVIELRGGLAESIDAAVTLHLPWTASWDMKYQINAERDWIPGTAIQLVLGAAQPSFSAILLAGKSFGRITTTAAVSAGRTNERLWRPGGTPFGTASETLAKEIYSWGGAIEYAASPIHRIFINAIAWNNVREQETPIVAGNSFGVNEGISWFFSAGLRLSWQMPQTVQQRATSPTVLRGYILAEPGNGSLEIGQIGLFRATVLTDSFTRYIRDGKRITAGELAYGMPVLVQGIPMPKPSTFLARSIEVQGEKQ